MEDVEEAHICPRREHNSYAPSRPNVLHCFGVDFLSNKEVLEVFAAWQPKQVEWLDDSSCNLVFEAEDSVQKAKQELAAPGQISEEIWVKTKPISVGKQKDAKKGKARRGGLKELCFQLRVATEADRKDPGHSGHTDSVYYAHVKEQQALEKQATELRRMKKRQRQMTPRRKDAAERRRCTETDASSFNEKKRELTTD
ncbi:ncbp3 [Symbiodinium natans]|uniref:Ncbp3 protein n=1 Tax=Symbiodinium natans TaxID=878477 RepID=A0A812S3X3_9DINO|nr:ncbp3 [Symbiodinium natans]